MANGLRVAVDARMLHATGIGRYLRELLASWRRAGTFAEVVLLGDPGELAAFIASDPSATPTRVVPHAGRPYSAAVQRSWLGAPRRAAAACDVSFFPHWDAPLVAPRAGCVVTLPDLTPRCAASPAGRLRRAVGRAALGRVVAGADAVVCVSRAAASEVLAGHPSLRGRLRVVPNGVSRAFGDAPAGPAPVDGPYLLWVGMLKPHKNPAAALDVLARVRAAGRTDVRLAVVGRAYPELDFVALAEARGLAGAVVALGEVGDAALRSLYAHCAALVFPSRAEGFGLPVLEAMAAGAPVVASDIPPVVEVAGGAAALFAPDDSAGMAAAVLTLLGDGAARAAAVARGRARAATFSWDAAAAATADVLAEAARGVARPAALHAPTPHTSRPTPASP